MATARRIVSLISSATEMLYLLGLGDRVVGVSHECDYPPQIAGQPRLTRSLVDSAASSREIDDQVRTLAYSQSALYMIDIEPLAALAPDLIVTQAQCDVCAVRYEDVVSAVRATPALKHTEILALNPRTLEDVFADLERVGSAAGCPAVAESVVAALRSRVDAVRSATHLLSKAQLPRVACLEWLEPPMLAANWTPQLIETAGGQPGLTVGGAHSTYANWQQIIDYNPQVVVLMPCGFDLERTILEAQVLPRLDGWAGLSAVRQGRVFATDGNAFFNRSGPRLVESLEILAHLFHPQIFEPPFPQPQRAWQRLETRGGALSRSSS